MLQNHLTAVLSVIVLSVLVQVMFPVPCQGQEDFRSGFIVTQAADTITGLIEYANAKSHAKYCRFKSSPDQKVVTYLPSELICYRFHGSRFYVSREIVREGKVHEVFLEYLVDGAIDLFYHADPFGDFFYIEKEGYFLELTDEFEITYQGGRRVKRFTRDYVGLIKYLMRDAPTLYTDIENIKFEHSSFVKISRDYHNVICPDERCIVYERKGRKLGSNQWRMRVGIAAARSSTDFTLVADFKRRIAAFIRRSEGFRAGTIVSFGSPLFLDLVSQSQLSTKYVTPILFVRVANNWRSSGHLEIQYHHAAFEMNPSTLHLGFWKGSLILSRDLLFRQAFRPFLNLGLSVNVFSRYELTDLDVRYFNLTQPAEKSSISLNDESFARSSHLVRTQIYSKVDMLTGIGVLLESKGGQQLKCELRYNFSIHELLPTNEDQLSDMQSLMILVGIST